MSKIDDKSGYDHVLLTKELTKYFGIQWGGLWWVCNIFPFRHQSQVSLFLSEKIRFWNSRLYDRETTLDILCSRERRGRLYYSGIREPSDIERSEGLLSGYEGRAIGSRNRANSSGSFLYLRPGGDSSFYWQTGQWKWPLSKPTLCTDPWSSLSEDVILRRRQSKWSWKDQDSRTVALPQERRPTLQSRADEKSSWWNFQLVFPKTPQEGPATLPSYSSRTLYGGNQVYRCIAVGGVIFFVQLACREKWPLHLWILLLPRAAFQLIFNSCLKLLATVELHFMD